MEFLRSLDTAIASQGRQLRFFRRQSAVLEFFFEQRQMRAYLSNHLLLCLLAAEEVRQPGKKPAHGDYAPSVSSLFTSPEICCQRRVSTESAFSPAFVML